MKLIRANSPETAHSTDDYPYGSLRTDCKWWIEKAEKGSQKGKYRVMQQTRNPKTNVWNKAHGSTYSDFMVLYIEDGTGHCKNYGILFNGSNYFRKFVATGLYAQLNDAERAEVHSLIRADYRYNLNEWKRFACLLAIARSQDTLDADVLLSQAKIARPDDSYLYESDAQEVVEMVAKERETKVEVVLPEFPK